MSEHEQNKPHTKLNRKIDEINEKLFWLWPIGIAVLMLWVAGAVQTAVNNRQNSRITVLRRENADLQAELNDDHHLLMSLLEEREQQSLVGAGEPKEDLEPLLDQRPILTDLAGGDGSKL